MGRPTRVKPLPAGTSRRGFFTKSGSAALALASAPMLAIAHDDDGDDDARTGGVAFDCGVASGDPLRDRVILWTRVTPSRPARGVLVRYKAPGTADYAGEWPRTWLANPDMGTVPAAAKNGTAAALRTFNDSTWESLKRDSEYKKMSFRIPAVKASQYLRLRGSNLPANVPFETDANGNPLPDIHTNATTTTATDRGTLKMACTVIGSNVPEVGVNFTGTGIDGCPSHLPMVAGVKYVAYDVAAWADLWFYSNPIYIEVKGSTVVAGVK